MSEPVAAVEPAQADVAPEVDSTDWKAESRKWEQRAKENSTAAKRLAQIEEAQKTAEQKAAEREAAAEQRAIEAEMKAMRREVALEHRLSSEDAALLDAVADEEAMQALAKRLATTEGKPKSGNYVPTEGRNPQTPSDDLRGVTRSLFRNKS